MSGTGVKQSPVTRETEVLEPGLNGEDTLEQQKFAAVAERQARILRLLWERRRSLLRAAAIGLLASTLVAFLIPKSDDGRYGGEGRGRTGGRGRRFAWT